MTHALYAAGAEAKELLRDKGGIQIIEVVVVLLLCVEQCVLRRVLQCVQQYVLQWGAVA